MRTKTTNFLLLSITFIVAITLSVRTSAQEYYFKHYNLNDGLSTMRVWDVYQDRRGFMWFATCEGLNYFDGHEFRIPAATSKNGAWLRSADVTGITEDSRGMLWMCCNKGLCCYDSANDSLTIFRNNKFEINSAKAIASDKNENIWAIGADAIYRLNPVSDDYEKYDSSKIPWCSSLFVAKSGVVYFMTFEGGIYRYNPQTDSFFHIYQIHEVIDGGGVIVGAAECDDGKLILATDKVGAVLFDPKNKSTRILFDTIDGNPIYIHSIMNRSNGEIWFGAENGIWIYKMGVGIIKHLKKSHTKENSLSDDVVHSLYCDKEGGIWVGTFFGGVNYLMSENYNFKKYYPKDKDGHIVANIVRNIVQDDEGRMFVAMEDGLVYSFHPQSVEAFKQLSPLSLNGKKISENIQAILPDGGGLWIGSLYDGVFFSDKIGNIQKHYDIYGAIPVTFYRSATGDVFLGTRTGLFRYDGRSDGFYNIDGLEGMFIHSIFQSSDNKLWVATLNGGLYSLVRQADTYKAEKEGLEDLSIATLYEDGKGNFWIGTQNNGLYMYDRVTETIRKPNQILCDNGVSVCMIVEDLIGRLWVSTSNGLFCYSINDDAVIKYNLRTLLASAHFNYNSAFINKTTGIIYFGTVDGMIVFNPLLLEDTSKPLNVYFADIDVGTSSFSISFCVPHYQTDRHLWFRYRIEGIDETWNVVQEKYSIRYNNLSPGKYTLQVSASLDNTNWSEEISEYNFEIKTPFWSSAWAKMIYILIFLSLIGLVSYLYWIRRRNMRRLTQFKQRNDKYIAIAKERMQFFTAITHEMRTPLTLILTPLESLIASFSPEKAKSLLPMMEKNAKELLILINQILDMKKLEQGSTTVDITRGDFMEYLRSIINPFRQVANKNKITFSFESDDHLIMCFDRKKMQSIIYNLLSNAFKFTPKGGFVKVSAHANDDNKVIITVSDSGIGIPKSELGDIFSLFYQSSKTSSLSIDSPAHSGSGIGLHLVKQFVQMHNGTIDVESQEDKGCTFVITLPTDLKETSQAAQHELDADNDSHESVADNGVGVRPKLLLVDDNEDFLKYLNAELKESYQIYLASNGKEALEIASNKDINIIVSDVMMPEMNGTELCRQIKTNINTSHIKIILLTAKTADQYQLEGYQSGADCYITKPFNILILKDRIKYLCIQQQERHQMFVQKQNVSAEDLVTSQLDKEFYDKAFEKVQANLDNCEYGVDQFSSDMCMSRMTLYRKLVSITGKTPSEFIKTLRLKKAADLLVTKRYSVSEVTAMTGFDNERSFYRSFKLFYGVTPSKYQ